jgi:hypothetical protein
VPNCPCCYRTCTAACADACVGLRCFAKSATQQSNLKPFTDYSVFVPRPVMDQALAQRSCQQQQLKEEEQDGKCSAFKAATEVVRKSAHCDVTGVSAFICRHGFVMRGATMTTAENFTYYEVQLADIMRAYSKEGRQLSFVFVDVACRMGPMLGR